MTVLPGPSAVTTAIAVSGLPADRFAFVGFLPRAAGALNALFDEIDAWGLVTVCFEAPTRLPRTLRAIASRAPARAVVVCRELTKLHEQVIRGPAAEVADRFHDPPRGEVTLVLAPIPSEPRAAADADVDAALSALRGAGLGARDAADVVARLSGRSRRDLYARTSAARDRG